MLTPTKKRVLPTAPKIGSPRTPRSKNALSKDKENKCGNYTPKRKDKYVNTVDSPLLNTKHCLKEASVTNKKGESEKIEEDSFFGLPQQKSAIAGEKKSINHRASLLLESEHALQPNYDNSSIKVAVRVRPFSDRYISHRFHYLFDILEQNILRSVTD